MKLVAFLLCLLAYEALAQKSKEITVGKFQKGFINGYVHFDDNNNPKDTIFYLVGEDFRYEYITEYIILAQGSLTEIRLKLTKCDEMFNEDVGTTYRFGKAYMSVDKFLGKRVIVSGIGDDSDGYYAFMKPQVTKAIKAIDQYRKANK